MYDRLHVQLILEDHAPAPLRSIMARRVQSLLLVISNDQVLNTHLEGF